LTDVRGTLEAHMMNRETEGIRGGRRLQIESEGARTMEERSKGDRE
jgi:hypothetical protein